jgi:hypothetical protein
MDMRSAFSTESFSSLAADVAPVRQLRNRLYQGMIGSTTSDASLAGWTRAFVFRGLKYESGWTRSLALCQALEMPSERSWRL